MCKKAAILISVFLVATNLGARTLMECAEIDDVNERVACYDELAGRVEEKLDKKHAGKTRQRVEAKNRSITEEVVGAEESPERRLTSMQIDRVVRNRNGRVVYVTTDGRMFRKISQIPANFRKNARVRLQDGVFGSSFLVDEDGLKLKVRELP